METLNVDPSMCPTLATAMRVPNAAPLEALGKRSDVSDDVRGFKDVNATPFAALMINIVQ